MKDKFLSEEDLDLRNLSLKERIYIWNAWLKQAQATNHLDEHVYSHSCFGYGVKIEFKKGKKAKIIRNYD